MIPRVCARPYSYDLLGRAAYRQPRDKDNLNDYAYVGNDPTDKTDPTGLQHYDSDGYQLDDTPVDKGKSLREWGSAALLASSVAPLSSAGFAEARGLYTAFRAGGWEGLRSALGVPVRMTIDDAQFGVEAGSHMKDFGLNASSAADRATFRKTVTGIGERPDRIVNGTFRGQGSGSARGAVQFRIKGNDVVVTTRDGKFVTVLKDGANNSSVQSALKSATCHTGSRIGC